ncbi:thiamine pyrophosphate-binding protein [Saccharothrix deserti]|uniref:thiamine pyrophosphate-binding protein n=1 Tax=Saccharothrix deserti TaxID=2593674 RepID=UPI00131E896C|nr:thiamine pyrophosphate-binding protein [Saccharothrix deserti]
MTTTKSPEQRDVETVVAAGLGRDVIFEYLRNAGVDQLFGVPGTNEVPIIDGTDVKSNLISYVPCLHENIALGAAMGYARLTGRPGVVELHVTPGVGHAIGNLYNAAKSHIPVVVLCGQQHSDLLFQEPLLASDLVRTAEQHTKWSYEVRGPDEIGPAMQRALKVALAPPQGPVFLSIPWEFTVQPARDEGQGRVTRIAPGFIGDPTEVERAARILSGAPDPVIVVGDGVGAADAWAEVSALADKLVNPRIYSEPLSSFMNYDTADSRWRGELPAFQEKMRQVFEGAGVAFLCGFNAQAQLVVFNWARGQLIPPDVPLVYLHNDPWQLGKNFYGEAAILGDIKATLPRITALMPDPPAPDGSRASDDATRKRDRERRAAVVAKAASLSTDGRIPGEAVAVALREVQDKGLAPNLTLVNEAVSDSGAFQKHLRFDTPTSYFVGQGGSLGYSMPAALGTALADGDRTVVNVVGDGSALFYPQCWWTADKLDLAILFVVLNNQAYKTLIIGLEEVERSYGWYPTGPAGYLRLPPPPDLDFVQLAAGYGITGEHVTVAAELEAALTRGLEHVRGNRRSYVIEVATTADVPSPEARTWFDEVVVVP